MVSPLLILGSLVATGVAVDYVVRKRKKPQEVPAGIAKNLSAEALAIAQQKMNEGVPPGEAARIAAEVVAKAVTTVLEPKRE